MTTVTPRGFLNKKEIEANYGRSYRSLTRDITRAVKSGDASILQHLKLVTEDDTVREGSDVTLDMIQDLSNNGLRPMWLAEETWVAEWCARRSNPRQDDATPIQPQPVEEPIVPTKNVESPAVVQLFQQRINDLATQNELLVGQLKIKDDQIRAANQQAEQSQQLMRDLHVLLKNVQDGLLGEGNRRLTAPRTPVAKSNDATPVPIPSQIDPARNRPTRRSAQASLRKSAKKRAPPTKPVPISPVPSRIERWFPKILGIKRRQK